MKLDLSNNESINGIGTNFYGKTDVRDDKSYVTVKWFVILLLPIYPIECLRVRKGMITHDSFLNIHSSENINYEILEKLPQKSFKKLILQTLLLSYGAVVALGLYIFFSIRIPLLIVLPVAVLFIFIIWSAFNKFK
jgi:hypothetical protein